MRGERGQRGCLRAPGNWGPVLLGALALGPRHPLPCPLVGAAQACHRPPGGSGDACSLQLFTRAGVHDARLKRAIDLKAELDVAVKKSKDLHIELAGGWRTVSDQ